MLGNRHHHRGGNVVAPVIGWLWRILIGRFTSCEHRWETMEKGQEQIDGRCIGYFVCLKCDKCGDWKSRSML